MRTADTGSPVQVCGWAEDFRPEPVDEESLATEAGFAKQESLKQEFEGILLKLVDMEVDLILVEGEVDSGAEEVLTDAGVLVAQQVALDQLVRVADYTGARILKLAGLKRSPEELEPLIGSCAEVEDEGRLGWLRISGGAGKALCFHLGGCNHGRSGRGARADCQRRGCCRPSSHPRGFLPGGGAAELALAREVEKYGDTVQGMEAFGVPLWRQPFTDRYPKSWPMPASIPWRKWKR